MAIDLDYGLVFHYKMDETAGLIAYDSSPNGNNGTLAGTGMDFDNKAVTGKHGGGLERNNSGQIVTCGQTALGQQEQTIACWFKDTGGTAGAVYIFSSRDNSAGAFSAYVDTSLDDIGIYIGTVWKGKRDVTTNLNDGEWHHVVIAFNGESKFDVFLDGALEGSITASGSWDTSKTVQLFERGEAAHDLDMALDDVRYYNRALSPMEAHQLYADTYYETLLVHLKMSDPTGSSVATDYSGNGNDGTLSGTAIDFAADGRHGGCVQRSASNDQISLGALGLPEAQSQTIACWVRWDNTPGTAYLVSTREDADPDDIGGLTFLLANSTSFRCQIGGTAQAAATISALQQGDWHHFACVYDYDAGAIHYYMDGLLITSDTSLTGTWDSSTDTLVTQSEHISLGGDFSMDDVRIYTRALTADEIQKLYANPNGDLILHWKLDETTGTVVSDASGNGHTGTLTSMTFQDDGQDAKFNRGLYRSTSADKIETDRPLGLGQDQDQTICCWVKYLEGSTAEGRWIVSQDGSAGGFGIYPKPAVNECICVIGVTTWNNPGAVMDDFDDGEWHHLAAVYKARNRLAKVYQDGVYKGQDVTVSGTWDRTKITTLGYSGSQKTVVDDVRIYGKALSDGEIATLAADPYFTPMGRGIQHALALYL